MKTPSQEECEALLREFEVPENILTHTKMVRRIANFLAKKISEKGTKIDLELVDKASLVHDFTKIYCFENNCSHVQEAERILSEKGFPEFGKLVKQHGLEEVNGFDKNTLIETKVVWYSDKRVNNDKLVSLGARYIYLKQRYGTTNDKKMQGILSTEENAKKTEKELFELAGMHRDILEDDLE